MLHSNRSLKLTAVALGLTTLASSARLAAEERPFEMGVYTNDVSGTQALAGDYDAAIASAARGARPHDGMDALVLSTNLCVAYTAKGNFPHAAWSCDRAVRIALETDGRSYPLAAGAGSMIARAFSNRGVLRALSGSSDAAAADFRRAARAQADSGAARRNLARLETSPAYRVARTGLD